MQHHRGVKIALALASKPQSNIVMRTVRRLKNADLNHPSNSKPDFQEVLSGVEIVVGVDSCEDTNDLETRIVESLSNSKFTERFGGLSIGESKDLIDDIQILEKPSQSLQWLTINTKGKIKLPLIVDYMGSKNTKMGKFSLDDYSERSFFSIS